MIENFRPMHDNVVIVLEPLPTETKSGLALVHLSKDPGVRESRTAKVVASGPGYYRSYRKPLGSRTPHERLQYSEPTAVFIRNETKPGDLVLIDSNAGQDYAWELNVPRHNFKQEFAELMGEQREFRIVREDEILGVLEPEAQAAE